MSSARQRIYLFTGFAYHGLATYRAVGPCVGGSEATRSIGRGYSGFVVGSLVESRPEEAAVSLPLACEEIVNLYLKDVDRSLIRENLRLSYKERLQQLQRNVRAANKIRGAGIRSLRIER